MTAANGSGSPRVRASPGARVHHPAVALAYAWLLLDFFGESRKRGEAGSTLTTTIFSQSFLGLLFAAMTFPEVPAVAFVAANLSLSTLLVGIGALGEPERGRARADAVLVGTAPLRRRTIVLVRMLHGGFHLVLITTGMALPPAVLFHWVSGGTPWAIPGYLAAASLCAGLLAGALASSVALAHAWLGPMRAQLWAGTAKALVLGGGVVGLVLCRTHLDGTVADLPLPSWLVHAWPPYLAARVLDAPLAAAVPYGAALVGAGVVVLALANLAARSAAGRRVRPVRPPLLAPLDRRLARGHAPLLGATAFVAAMLYRSPAYRGRVLPLLGVPMALIVLALAGEQGAARLLLIGVSLQFPAIFLPFLLAFLSRADQPRVGWLFATSPSAGPALAREAALLALVTRFLLPLHLLAVAGMLLWLPVLPAVVLGTASFAAAVLVAAVFVRALEAMPFTVDGDVHEGLLDFGGLLVAGVALAAFGAAIAWLAARPLGAILAGALLLLALARLGHSPKAATGDPGMPGAAPITGTGPVMHGAAPLPEPAPEPPPLGSVRPSAPPTLRRELWAVAVLYLAVAILPALLGMVASG